MRGWVIGVYGLLVIFVWNVFPSMFCSYHTKIILIIYIFNFYSFFTWITFSKKNSSTWLYDWKWYVKLMEIHETYCDNPHPHTSPSYSRPCSHNLLANGHPMHPKLINKQMDNTNSRDASFDAYCLMTLDDGYLKLVSQMNKVTALTLELHCYSKYSNTQTYTQTVSLLL